MTLECTDRGFSPPDERSPKQNQKAKMQIRWSEKGACSAARNQQATAPAAIEC
eukprot:COSAG02_NODE_4385_length_5421_cov_4.928035_10_plen_53_part_00